MKTERELLIRRQFDEYLEMYASRDEALLDRFSENFSGCTGGGNFLVKSRDAWVNITRQDFSQVGDRIRFDVLDFSIQDVSSDVAIVTATFHIHLPIPDHFFSRETTRLVLVFRLENDGWKIVHNSYSNPYHMVQEGEVFPIHGLQERNRELELLIEERTQTIKEANDKLEAQSNTDWLTCLANRRYFDRMLVQEWNRAQRAESTISLIMLDVDHFKHYNDEYGHQAGDLCLQALAKAMTQTARRAGDLVARYGGDEFVVLLPETNADDALEIARRIQREVWSLSLPHIEIPMGIITVSVGVASLIPSNQQIPEDLVLQADLALYQAKKARHNCLQ